ncbi:MAG: nucleoside monophosphate kinase [Patescibacteria group bacterium]|nr:MAG: nucleoside monophosphate kinase [Patescibacteria group bacterium]
MKRMKVAVLGTQASGKGTQSHILSVIMGVQTASVGELLRELQNEDSKRGHTAKIEMAKGAFVDDDIIMPLVKDWVSKHPEGWILDGFPRSVEQAKKCESFFKPDAVLYLEVPDEDSKKRISYRRLCSKCKTNYNLITQPPHSPNGTCDKCGGELVRRGDDTPELVEERLRHYHEVTEPLKEWFAARGKLVLVDARKGIAEVAHEAELKLEDLFHRKARARRLKLWGLIFLALAVVTFAVLTITGYILNS